MIKEVVRIPYFKRYIGKKGVSFYFSPPSYIVKTVLKNSDGNIKLKNKKLSDDFELAKDECLEIYRKDIKPYLNSVQEEEAIPKQTLRYIWKKFCECRGIDFKEKEGGLLYKKLSNYTKRDYRLAFNRISKVKNKHNTLFVDLNQDLVTRPIIDKTYEQLVVLCKARSAKKAMDLLRELFTFGKYNLSLLKQPNPYKNLNVPNPKNEQPLWTEKEIEIFNQRSIELGKKEVGLALRLNVWLGQRPADLFNINMSQVLEVDGYHVFELIPHKTESYKTKSYAPIPPELWEEIKNRTGRLIQYESFRTFSNHFSFVKKNSPVNQNLSLRVARNTASTLYYEAGSTTTENMNILGHKTENTNTITYRKNTARQSVNAMKKLLEKKQKSL